MGRVGRYKVNRRLSITTPIENRVLTNEDLVAVIDHGHGILGILTAGCPIIPSIPTDRVRTIAGMALIAERGELYFNLHTKGQMFFGDIRGQLSPVQ